MKSTQAFRPHAKKITDDLFIPEIQSKLFLIQVPMTRDGSEFFWILEHLRIDKGHLLSM